MASDYYDEDYVDRPDTTHDEDGDAADRIFSPTVSMVLVSFLLVLGGPSNLFMCLAMLVKESLRSVKYNFFICSLALTDLLVVVLLLPWWNDAFGAKDSDFPEWFYCKVWANLDRWLTTSSMFHMAAISVAFQDHIVNNVSGRTVSARKYLLAVAGVWAASFLVALWPVVYSELKTESTRTSSGNDSSDLDPEVYLCQPRLEAAQQILDAVLVFFLPFLLLTVMHVKTYRTAQAHMRRLTRISAGSLTVSERKVHRIRHLLRSCVNLAVVIATFVVCWLPFYVVMVIKSLDQAAVSSNVVMATLLLGYAKCCLNPAIYTVFNTQYRRYLRLCLGGNNGAAKHRYDVTNSLWNTRFSGYSRSVLGLGHGKKDGNKVQQSNRSTREGSPNSLNVSEYRVDVSGIEAKEGSIVDTHGSYVDVD